MEITNAVWSFRPATEPERKYGYSCDDGDKVCKCIGHLRGDFGRSGTDFWTTWFDHNWELNTPEFKEAIDSTINRLRDASKEIHPLTSRSSMRHVCWDYREARDDVGNFFFRVDCLAGGEHSFIMRMKPEVGFYDLYCYCYRTEDLDSGLALKSA